MNACRNHRRSLPQHTQVREIRFPASARRQSSGPVHGHEARGSRHDPSAAREHHRHLEHGRGHWRCGGARVHLRQARCSGTNQERGGGARPVRYPGELHLAGGDCHAARHQLRGTPRRRLRGGHGGDRQSQSGQPTDGGCGPRGTVFGKRRLQIRQRPQPCARRRLHRRLSFLQSL